MDFLKKGLESAADFVWSAPMLALLVGCGVFLTLRLGFVQVKYLPQAFKFMLQNEKNAKGEVSSFGALCTSLSATVGTGNIVGVAAAVTLGGPGALFWMWLAAFFGMATKFAECTLAAKFRLFKKDGGVLGGPFMYMEMGLGRKFRPLAKLFAFFGAGAGLLGIGTVTQVNNIAAAAQNFFDPQKTDVVCTIFGSSYCRPTVLAALISGTLAALVILGGVKRIAKAAELTVPFMMILYVGACLWILAVNYRSIPHSLALILHCAFTGSAAAGGFSGAMLKEAIQIGVSRGVFSNEAGLGSAPIAAASAQTNLPARQGLVSMTATFIDTLVICTMTGFVVIGTGCHEMGIQGAAVTAAAFEKGFSFMPGLGSFILTVCLICFAFTTILGWNFYSLKCVEYLWGGSKTAVKKFQFLYICAVFAGPFVQADTVWNLADIMNGMMALPNLLALFVLSSAVAREKRLL